MVPARVRKNCFGFRPKDNIIILSIKIFNNDKDFLVFTVVVHLTSVIVYEYVIVLILKDLTTEVLYILDLDLYVLFVFI